MNKEHIFRLLDMFPIPVELYTPDGAMAFINRAFLELNKVSDAGRIIGKYNILHDPAINGKPDIRECIHRAFRGEAVCTPDFPLDDSPDRYIAEKTFETAFGDMFFSPLWDEQKIAYILCVFVVKKMYFGRPDVVHAKAYLDAHWQDEYNPRAVANSLNISVARLYNLFKHDTGMTPGNYHKKVKVEHLKEKLADKSISVKEAFAACGEDSQGWAVKMFKKVTGMPPRQYRKSL